MDSKQNARDFLAVSRMAYTPENPRPLEWVDLDITPNGRDTTEPRRASLSIGGRSNPRGCFRVSGVLYHGENIQPETVADAEKWIAVLQEWIDDNPDGLPVLSVDAWREPGGGWTHNATYSTGETFPRVFLERGTLNTRGILAWFRDHGLLDPVKSCGKVAVVDDGSDGLEIVARGTREPLFWIPWHDENGEGLA